MKYFFKSFQELSVEELYDILKLRNQIFIIEQECIYQDCDGKDKESIHLFIKDEEKLVAYLRIPFKGVTYRDISIGRVVVDPRYRNRGLARKLLIKAIDYIKDTLIEDKIVISAHLYLKSFYESLGFKVMSETYLEDNIPHIEMHLG
jgi:ElaA protein